MEEQKERKLGVWERVANRDAYKVTRLDGVEIEVPAALLDLHMVLEPDGTRTIKHPESIAWLKLILGLEPNNAKE